MTLIEFLLARIAEDETSEEVVDLYPVGAGRVRREVSTTEPSDRVLAECEAKRLLIQRAESLAEYVDGTREDSRHTYEWTLLRLLAPLALPYADHTDYLPEWKP